MATWIKCTNTKHEVVYVNLDNAVTVTRNDVADRIAERGTVISFMGGEQVQPRLSRISEVIAVVIGVKQSRKL
jgi:hypothetical protein